MSDNTEYVCLSDSQAEKLLELIWVAITEYGSTDPNMSLRDFVEDVAMSMDTTTDRADMLRTMIGEFLA